MGQFGRFATLPLLAFAISYYIQQNAHHPIVEELNVHVLEVQYIQLRIALET